MPVAFVSRRAPGRNLFRADDLNRQREFFARHPQLAATPVRRLPALAGRLEVGELLLKDETARFGLNAFKAAGAVFAVHTLLDRGAIRAGDMLVCASEGNHGRAVARAARDVGCAARVYMSDQVARARVQAIESEGASVVLVAGTYDEAVRTMAREAEAHGWAIVSDTSWPGYTEIPWLIMLGYTRIMDEIAEQQQGPIADAIFVPAGVGGLLASVACWCDLHRGTVPGPGDCPPLGGLSPSRGTVPLSGAPRRPMVVAVEPVSAACVQESVRAGRPTVVSGPFDTTMGGLRCGEMSPSVFPAVASLVDAFVAIEDDFAFDAMRRLARPAGNDPAIACGPSGAAALGGVLALLSAPGLAAARAHLQLGVDSRIVVLTTEGVTDPVVFREVLARH